MSVFYGSNWCAGAKENTPVTGAFTRREMMRQGFMAAAAAAMFGGGVENLGAQRPSSSAELLKPGTKLSAIRALPDGNIKSGNLRLQRDPSERYVMVSSKDLDPKIGRALGDPLIISAMLRRIDPQDKPVEGGVEFGALIVPVTLFKNNGTGGFFVLVHDHFPPPMLEIEGSISGNPTPSVDVQ
jgi:hypothetical protein